MAKKTDIIETKIKEFANKFMSYLQDKVGSRVMGKDKYFHDDGEVQKQLLLSNQFSFQFRYYWGDNKYYFMLFDENGKYKWELSLSRILFNSDKTITWLLAIPSAKSNKEVYNEYFTSQEKFNSTLVDKIKRQQDLIHNGESRNKVNNGYVFVQNKSCNEVFEELLNLLEIVIDKYKPILDDIYQEPNLSDLSSPEKKKLKSHLRYEGRISSTDVKKMKKILGCKCDVCGEYNFGKHYPGLGEDFIELHHLRHHAQMKVGETVSLTKNDFAVLCSNCHKMIHKIKNPSYDENDIKTLRRIYKK